MPRGQSSSSGPPPDPNSGRSEARGLVFTALPADGYKGKPPTFPLAPFRIFRWEYEGDRRFQVFDSDATREFKTREQGLWKWAWSLPQACAWISPSERWRLHTVAMWVRTAVVCEGSEATAADKNSLHRFADGIGLTTAGMRMNGWQVAPVQVAPAADEPSEAGKVTKSRLAVVKSA